MLPGEELDKLLAYILILFIMYVSCHEVEIKLILISTCEFIQSLVCAQWTTWDPILLHVDSKDTDQTELTCADPESFVRGGQTLFLFCLLCLFFS